MPRDDGFCPYSCLHIFSCPQIPNPHRHGGDNVNAVHMSPGRAVVEIVNCGFHLANREWLDQCRVRLRSGLRHFRLIARQPASQRQALRMPDGWNANATVPWPALRAVLESVVDTFARHNAARGQATSLHPAQPWPAMDCSLVGVCREADAHLQQGSLASRWWAEQCDRACKLNPVENGCGVFLH